VNQLYRNLTSRAVTSPIQFLFLLTTTWLATTELGPESYSAVILLAGIPLLFPFLDLGSSSVLLTGLARDPNRHERLKLFAFAERRSLYSACLVLVIGALVSQSSLPQNMLGHSSKFFESPTQTFLQFSLAFAVLIILNPAYKVLIGLGKNHLTMYFGLATSTLTLCATFGLTLTSLPADFYALTPISCSISVGLFVFARALSLTGLEVRKLIAATLSERWIGNKGMAKNSNFMLVLTISLTVMQFSDRYVVAHFGKTNEVPEYVYVSQIYVPAWAAISSVLIALWPHMSTIERKYGSRVARAELLKIWKLLTIIGFTAGGVFALSAPIVVSLITSNLLLIDPMLPTLFGILLALQFMQFPLGVFLTSNAGLKFQSLFVSMGAAFYLPISALLTTNLGVIGPTVAAIIVLLFFQLIPNAIYITKVRNDE
jgi:O-antigen/teichoic acid export membrane protein